MHDLTAFWMAIATTHAIEGDMETAEQWLLKIPRSDRGKIRIVLDDLDMCLSRMGNGLEK